MMPTFTRVCVPCRNANPPGMTCQLCGKPTQWSPKYWRAPRKSNKAAWRRIENGDWWWDHHAVDRAGRRWNPWRASARLMGRILRPEEVRDEETWKHRYLGPKRRG